MNPDITVPPGLITWFGEFPEELGGPCTHPCNHKHKEVIAWGPTLEKYEQVLCKVCKCRGWRRPRGAADFRMVIS